MSARRIRVRTMQSARMTSTVLLATAKVCLCHLRSSTSPLTVTLYIFAFSLFRYRVRGCVVWNRRRRMQRHTTTLRLRRMHEHSRKLRLYLWWGLYRCVSWRHIKTFLSTLMITHLCVRPWIRSELRHRYWRVWLGLLRERRQLHEPQRNVHVWVQSWVWRRELYRSQLQVRIRATSQTHRSRCVEFIMSHSCIV